MSLQACHFRKVLASQYWIFEVVKLFQKYVPFNVGRRVGTFDLWGNWKESFLLFSLVPKVQGYWYQYESKVDLLSFRQTQVLGCITTKSMPRLRRNGNWSLLLWRNFLLFLSHFLQTLYFQDCIDEQLPEETKV